MFKNAVDFGDGLWVKGRAVIARRDKFAPGAIEVAAPVGHEAIGALGAAEGNKTKRSHFVFEKGGKLVDKKIPVKHNERYVSNLSVAFPAVLPTRLSSSKLALEFIKGHTSN